MLEVCLKIFCKREVAMFHWITAIFLLVTCTMELFSFCVFRFIAGVAGERGVFAVNQHVSMKWDLLYFVWKVKIYKRIQFLHRYSLANQIQRIFFMENELFNLVFMCGFKEGSMFITLKLQGLYMVKVVGPRGQFLAKHWT